MLATAKALSLIEQKKLQWAKEREEMVGLYGLWGRPRNSDKEKVNLYNRTNLLPPIKGKSEFEEATKENFKVEEESETSGYLSDSPKHQNESNEERDYLNKSNEQLNNEAIPEEIQNQYWNQVDDSENYWAEKKMYKNYKNENWAHQNTESYHRQNQRLYHSNKNFWYGTPESVSSDDGSRLRWGDRGVGIGHLWEPVVNAPDCRLPLVGDPYRQTPKWVEKGLKNSDGNKADILIIHHPDDDQYHPPAKNYLLGQNAPIPPEVIEERERKRKKALEHQNAIKKQLEEREMKRRLEKENRIREEKMEEERIRKEQEIERLRYEEEQRKMKQKEEIEKKKEEAMREAIEAAEKRAKEEKRLSKKHGMSNNQKNHQENEKTGKLERILEQAERGLNNRRQTTKTPRHKKTEEVTEIDNRSKTEQNEKTLKDSSSQFEDIQLASSFQLLNVNGLPVDGGLALMLDTPPKDNNFLLPPDGVQLALLMSPRNANSTNHLLPDSPLVSRSTNTGERTLTPSKYRISERVRFNPSSKSTQTDFKYGPTWTKLSGGVGRVRKQNRRCGTNSGSSGTSPKCNEMYHKHIRCFLSSKYRSKPHPSKNLEDRPKWGINRPSVQYKKQSEKDPYYQKKMKDRLKKAGDFQNILLKTTEKAEKEMSSVVTFLDCQTDEDEKAAEAKEEILLRNGYRMNSNLSSPVFVPIGTRLPSGWEEPKKGDDSERSNYSMQFESGGNEDEEDAAVPGSVGFLTQAQLEAITQIASLREKKEPAQVLDLSKIKITSKEEFRKYLDKIPECKVKPEKIAPESMKVKDKEFSFVPGKKEEKQGRDWSYLDPTPPDMKGAKLEDLCPVNIDWKMLTTIRPKTKVDEDMFSRLVQLGKLDLKYQNNLKKEKSTDWIRKTKNPKSSIIEMRVVSCKECGEDFCDGSMCSKLMYDCFFRPQPTTSTPSQNLLLAAETGEPRKKKRKKRKGKKKVRKQKKGRKGKLGKNSIFNRPASRGCSRDHSRRCAEIAAKPRWRALSSTRSFSTEKTRASFYEGRSKSAPRIHFQCDVPGTKSKRFEFTSDSGPSQSEYSSRSDSQSPDFHRKFSLSRLRLSGRRKLLSARVGFVSRNQPGSSTEGRSSSFVRKCTLYKGYHSDASIPDSQNEEDEETSSDSSTTPPRSRSTSKSPNRIFPAASTSAKYPSTVQIQFDDYYATPGLRFPEKIYLPSRAANKTRRRHVHHAKSQEMVKLAEGFSKIELEFDEESATAAAATSAGRALPRRPKTSTHVSRSRTWNKLSTFSGPYLKAKGLSGKKLD